MKLDPKIASAMPRYRCHKVVRAVQIVYVERNQFGGGFLLAAVSDKKSFMPIYVDSEWKAKHEPRAGGYLVLFEDGYVSYSPKEAFEDGYSRIDVPVEDGDEQLPAEANPLEPLDQWAHSSYHMRCGTCMWFAAKLTTEGSGELGRCRRHAPTMAGYPATFQNDWCGDHKLDEDKA